MKLEDLLNSSKGWFRNLGPDGDVAFSSRVRLARNLKSQPFPNRATESKRQDILEDIEEAVLALPQMKESIVLRMDELSDVDKQFLSERYLISRELAAQSTGSAVIVDENESISIMINEEDHLRIQVLMSGMRFMECWELIHQIDEGLQKNLEFAYSESLGYLTACPTNIGTGMRVSAMLHLPGLSMANQIAQVLQAIAKLGLAIRGLYGEGTDCSGNLYQISNQITLGRGENEIIANIEKVVRQIALNEKDARNQILKSQSEKLYDIVGRAYGILSNAHIINTKETLDYLSTLRMGLDLSIISRLKKNDISELFIMSQPAHIQKIRGRELDAENRDIERSNLLRSRLANN